MDNCSIPEGLLERTERAMAESDMKTLPPRTHCFELLQLVSTYCRWKFTKVNFTANGIEGVFTDDFDGQEYILKIRPKEQE